MRGNVVLELRTVGHVVFAGILSAPSDLVRHHRLRRHCHAPHTQGVSRSHHWDRLSGTVHSESKAWLRHITTVLLVAKHDVSKPYGIASSREEPFTVGHEVSPFHD